MHKSDDLVFRETYDYEAMRRLALASGLEEGSFDGYVASFGFYRGPELVACAALRIRGEQYTVECLVVEHELRGRGVGTTLVRRVEEEARIRGGKKLWAVARAPEFFEKMGFIRRSGDEPGGPSIEGCKNCRQYLRMCQPGIFMKEL